MEANGKSRPSGGVKPLVAVAGITLVAALLRLASLWDAFWLDEIWSLRLASTTDSALGVFTSIHHDNNHYLNTFWLRALGGDAPWALYRAPAFLAGVATVMLAGGMESRRGLGPGLLAAALFGLSYPFVHYSTEARGYGLVVLLALAAYVVLERLHREGRARDAAVFAFLASIGFLAHLTFLTVYLPLLTWSVWATVARRDPLRRALRTAAAHFIPLALLLVLILVDIRHLVRGGGPELLPLRGWLEAWAYTLGLPLNGATALVLVLGLAFGAAVLVGLWETTRREPAAWVFLGLVLVFPLALLIGLRTGYAPPRYFLASLTFGLLLVGRGLTCMLQGRRLTRFLAVGLLLVAVVGNGWRVARFVDDGRGRYQEVVAYLASHTEADTIRVASDYDFGASMVLGYYEKFLPASKELAYLSGEGPTGSADWYLVHELGDQFDPPEILEVGVGDGYVLQETFPKFGLSGWNWALYRRGRSLPRELQGRQPSEGSPYDMVEGS